MTLATVLIATSCGRDRHFITDRQYRQQVHHDFANRQAMIEACMAEGLQQMQGKEMPQKEIEALEFLLAYMPYSDLADYPFDFYRQQVQYAFMARDSMPWGHEVPEDVFRHFVLVYRVNNENLDTARVFMYHALKERLQGLSIEEAALEVNHWCHEHVAYRAADARTSAPLATMRTALGRCGEESTFTVTALRAVGIPARQCYTPRWAHCDDNHAWVEVWTPTGWKFLGACEPDPELNMGWFAVPSTRCMMVHSKAFGRYRGDEEVVKQTALYSELNLLSHYAPTRRVTITVTDGNDRPVADAEVKFKLYNYSEYYTLATVKSNSEGQASLTTGLGDLLIWACKGDRYAYQKLDVRQQDTLTLVLWREGENRNSYIADLDMVPPTAGEAKVTPTAEATTRNAQRLAYEDSLRTAYMATFMCNRPRHTWGLQPNDNLSEAQIVDLIAKSEGNHQQIVQFLNSHTAAIPANGNPLLYDYLTSYSDKDLRDISAEVLEAHLTPYSGDYSIFRQGLLPARISNELVRPWRQPLAEALIEITDYPTLRQWTIENIAVDDSGNYYNCPISPMGVYRLRHADAHSRDIFFVAACRAIGIPAYLDNATNQIYVWDESSHRWESITFSAQTAPKATATLTLTYRGTEPKTPTYYPHFTLQRYEDGDFVTFDFEGDPRMASFPATITLDREGYYCLSTGNRYPDGKVLNRMEFFSFEGDGNTITKEIVLRPLVAPSNETLPTVDPNFEIFADMATLADYADNTGMIYINLGSGKHYREPSKHLVKELLEHQQELAQWGGMTYAIAPNAIHETLRTLSNIDMVDADNDPLGNAIVRALGITFNNDYPLVALINSHGEIRYHSEGYRIGIVDQLLKALH